MPPPVRLIHINNIIHGVLLRLTLKPHNKPKLAPSLFRVPRQYEKSKQPLTDGAGLDETASQDSIF